MHDIPLLRELAIIEALSVVAVVVLARLRLPAVTGLIAAGALMGPHGFGLITSLHDIEMLAEVGVVLLLFTIGLEFSLDRMKTIFSQVALGGILQVGVTFAITVGISYGLGQPLNTSIFFGFAIALSSTAIVLRTLSERQELDAPHGRFIIGTLIFQDLCVIPMVLIVPLLGADAATGDIAQAVLLALVKAAVVVILTLMIARYVVPLVLGTVDASRSREVFLLAILSLCIGTAWLTSFAGLSLALGAFLGGMVVAGTEYGHRAMSDVLPLRDAFVSLFFVVIGMLFNYREVLESPLLVASLLFCFLFVKGAIATMAALVMRFPARAAWLAGVGLAQFGEFGFVLTNVARQSGVVDAATVEPLMAAGVLSMFLTPVLVKTAPHITAGERLLLPLERLFGVRSIDEFTTTTDHHRKNHVIIVGFGVAGRLAAKAAQASGPGVIVLDMNIENVRKGRELGLPVYYGDATSEEALHHAGIQDARLLVLLMNDPAAAERIVNTVRRVAPKTPVLMRTRYLTERGRLFDIGAHDVVAEEVEGAVEVVSRMLRRLEIPRNVIDAKISELRTDTQTSDRKKTSPRPTLKDVRALDDLKIESVYVHRESPVIGASPASLQLRSKTGVLVVGVRREEKLLESPDPNVPFQVGDIVFLVGTSECIRGAMPLFGAPS